MAKVPGAVPVKSRLHGALGVEAATELYRCFLLDRLDALAGVRGIVPVVAFTPPEAMHVMASLAPGFQLLAQRGDDLGARLASVIDTLLGDGHAAVVATDADSPTLPMTYVERAAATLAAGEADVVIGPSDDGGYYLVGVRRPCAGLFDGVPWSTSRTRATTVARAEALGLRVSLLPSWFDVDTAEDLARLRAELGTRRTPGRTARFVRQLAC